MIVKRPKFFLLWAVLLVLHGQSEAKILPSLLASFHNLTPRQKELSDSPLSHLSKNFRDDGVHAPTEPIKISKSLVSTPDSGSPADRQLGAAENYAAVDINFETTEIKDVVGFVEYKMNEITSLVQECIEQEYAADVSADVEKIRHECVGSTYQILFFNYNEGMKKVKEVLLEILKLKLQNLKEDYEDETNFFLDVLESLVNKDYSIPQSLQLAKKASKYYVSPRYFDRLIAITNPEVQAFTVLHERLKEQRNKIQDQLRQKEENEEEFIDAIERKARRLRHKTRVARKAREVHQRKPPAPFNGYLNGLSALPAQQAALARLNPAQMANVNYLKDMEDKISGLSLFRNPALPAQSVSPSDNLPLGLLQGQGNLMVKKV